MSEDDAARLARALYAAYNEHDAPRAAALYHPEGTHYEMARGTSVEGRTAVANGLAGFLGLFPDACWEPLEVIGGATAVAVPYRLTGTLQAQLGSVAPRGQRLDLRGVHVVRARESSIAATEDYWDGATFNAQMRGED